MITKFTITGADDGTNIDNLIDLQQKYPFVEWGLLVMENRYGTSRFPSFKWLETFIDGMPSNTDFSLHLCGNYVEDLFAHGITSFIFDVPFKLWCNAKRVQMNTHGVRHVHEAGLFSVFVDYEKSKEFIFQYDNLNSKPLLEAKKLGIHNVSALFDLSHGAGILPSEWPKILPDVKCGYAGGLSPENLAEQIVKINQASGLDRIWIDIETHVRTNGHFDLDKVDKVLGICKKSMETN